MTPAYALFSISFFFLSAAAAAAAASASASASVSSPTVYEILSKYGLPPGLLPSSVVSYNLSSSNDDGRFFVRLSSPCYIQFDYLVYYDEEITGKLRYGSITELKGIQVQRFFFWLDVDEIRVDLPPADCIYFQVGLINKKLDIDQFRMVNSCRDKGSLQLQTPLEDMGMLLSE